MKNLRDRVAVITGGAGGIGLAMAERFAAQGMNVAVADVDAVAAAGAADRLRRAGAPDALGLAVDVRRPDSLEALADAVYARWGAAHVLCNNAGVQLPGRLWEFTPEEWDWLLSVNLLGVVNGIRVFVPRMIAGAAPGHIVNTASVGGLVAYPGIGIVHRLQVRGRRALGDAPPGSRRRRRGDPRVGAGARPDGERPA